MSFSNESIDTASPLVSIIVPLYNGGLHIQRLLTSIFESTYQNLEVIIVDDASTDNGLEIVTSMFPVVKVLRNRINRGKSWCLNLGISTSRGDFLVMTDQDLVFQRELVARWVSTLMTNSHIGICGCYVYYDKSRNFLFTAGGKFNKRNGIPRPRLSNVEMNYADEHYEESYDWIFDNLYIVRRSVLDSIGVYDHINFPILYEEADLQLRASLAGYSKSLVPGARAFHDIPIERMDQLRRFTKYKAEMLCRNRLILIRKMDLATLPMMSALSLRSLLFYTFVAAIQRAPLKEKTSFFKSVVKGVSRGLTDPIARTNPKN